MGRKPTWPPAIQSRRGQDYIRIATIGGRRWITLGPAGSPESRREYARILAEVEAAGGILRRPVEGLTVPALVAAYLPVAIDYYDTRQGERVKRALRPVGELYGHMAAADFGPLALKATRETYVGAGYCRRYCNQLTDCVRRCWKWGVAEELVPQATYAALQAVEGLRRGRTEAPDHPAIQPASFEQVERTLFELPAIPAAMVRLQLLTGMRPGEVCLLRPADLDRDWLMIDGVQIWLYRLDKHKGRWRGHLRWIPLGPKAQAVLAPYLEREPEAYCFSPRECTEAWLVEHGRKVRLNRRWTPGGRYSTRTYANVINRACKRAGVEWSPNQLRHTVATGLEARFGREAARVVLGHSTPSTTAIYARSVEAAAKFLAEVG